MAMKRSARTSSSFKTLFAITCAPASERVACASAPVKSQNSYLAVVLVPLVEAASDLCSICRRARACNCAIVRARVSAPCSSVDMVCVCVNLIN